jgi:type I restriction enzyme, S subunit
MTTDRTHPEGWRRVRFGDAVRQVKQTTKDPESDGLDRIVGLDHLDSESLPLRRWNELADLPDGTSFTRTFRAGQVLFGKRRAYQRKVAVAAFDGVCSGDILVFEPSTDDLLPGFLPYIVQSDGFFNHALGTSAGSLSPRTKWQELATYEFALPPVAVQRSLSDLLHAASEAVATAAGAYESADAHLRSLAMRFVTDPAALVGESAEIDHVPLSTLCEIRRGRFSHRPRNEPRLYSDGGPHPFVQTGDVQSAERFIAGFSQFLSDEGVTYSRCVPDGTLLVTIAAVIGALAYTTTTTYLPDSVVSVAPRRGVELRYLEFLLRGLRHSLETRVATENTQKNLSVELLGSVAVPIVPSRTQRWIAELMDSAWDVVAQSAVNKRHLQSVEASLRERLLRDGHV